MKTKMSFIGFFCFLLIFLVQAQVFATNYYVSTSGNDGNNGLSNGSAWRTIAKACSTVPENAGHVINIGAGTFYETSQINLPSGVTILGASKSLTTIQNSGSVIFYANNKSDIVISDFKIDGRERATPKGFRLEFCNNIEIKNFTMTEFTTAVDFRSGTNNKVHDFDGTNVSYCTQNAISIVSWETDICENFEIYNGNCTNDDNYHGKIVGGGVDQTMPGYDGRPWDMPPPTLKNIKIHDISFHTSVVGCFLEGQPQLGLEFWNLNFDNFEIYNMKCNMAFSMAGGCPAGVTKALRIHHCRWEDCGDYAIECFPANFEIDHNYFDGCAYPIANFGTNPDRHNPNLQVHHNVFYRTYLNTCLNLSESYDGIKFYKNTIYSDSKQNAFNMPGSINIEVNNNIFYSTVSGCNPDVSANIHDNLFYNWNTTGTNSVTRNPSFNSTGNKPSPFFQSAETAYGAYTDGDWTAGPGSSSGVTKYEAENASISGGLIANDVANYSGTGFWWVPTQGNSITFTVNASAGAQDIVCRFGNGNGAARTMSLYVNGTKIRQVSFPATANWDTWADKVDNVTLNDGNNTIKYQFDSGDNGEIDIDHITVNTRTTSSLIVTARGENAPGEGIDKLYDDTKNTKWVDFSTTSWVQFAYSVGQIWNRYEIISANDSPTRDPKNWNIQGSNDGSSWTTLSTQSNQTWANRLDKKAYTFTNTNAYKYYKWNITANNGAIETQSAELIFSRVTARGDNASAGEGIDKLSDDITTANNKWLDQNPTSWTQVQYYFGQVWNKYEITSGNDDLIRDPKNWTIQGSNDGATWTTMNTQTNQAWASRNLTKAYTYTNANAYLFYKWTISANNGAPVIQVSDLKYSNSSGLKSAEVTTDIDVAISEGIVKIYPNPSSGIVNVELKDYSTTDIFVYDLQGKLLYLKKATKNIEQFDLSAYIGTIIIKVKTENETFSKKVLLTGN